MIEESALESSASLYPLAESFPMKKPFFLTNVSRLLLLLLYLFLFVRLFVCIADDLTLKETVEDGLRMALRTDVQKLTSLCLLCMTFDVQDSCFIKSFPFVNTHYIEEQNTQGPSPSNRRQDHEDHSSYPFRANTYRETYQTNIDRWSMS